ncbi:MAG: sodium:solute symporter family transporter [Planctomycetota bacterium]
MRRHDSCSMGPDYAAVIAYLAGIMLLGLYFKRFVHSSKDYFLAGKSLPFWAIGMSIVVSDIGAQDFVGVSGGAYRYGIAVGNFDWIGSVPTMLLGAGQSGFYLHHVLCFLRITATLRHCRGSSQ